MSRAVDWHPSAHAQRRVLYSILQLIKKRFRVASIHISLGLGRAGGGGYGAEILFPSHPAQRKEADTGGGFEYRPDVKDRLDREAREQKAVKEPAHGEHHDYHLFQPVPHLAVDVGKHGGAPCTCPPPKTVPGSCV